MKVKNFFLGFIQIRNNDQNFKFEIIRGIILFSIFIFLNAFPFVNRDENRGIITVFMIIDALFAALCIYRLLDGESDKYKNKEKNKKKKS